MIAALFNSSMQRSIVGSPIQGRRLNEQFFYYKVNLIHQNNQLEITIDRENTLGKKAALIKVYLYLHGVGIIV